MRNRQDRDKSCGGNAPNERPQKDCICQSTTKSRSCIESASCCHESWKAANIHILQSGILDSVTKSRHCGGRYPLYPALLPAVRRGSTSAVIHSTLYTRHIAHCTMMHWMMLRPSGKLQPQFSHTMNCNIVRKHFTGAVKSECFFFTASCVSVRS